VSEWFNLTHTEVNFPQIELKTKQLNQTPFDELEML